MPTFIQPSFAKGEIAPELHGRVDTAAYQVALAKARNVIIHPSGGVSNRAGQYYLEPVKDHSYAPRLIRFQYRTDDAYILEFGDFYMRVIRNDAHVLASPAATITGATTTNPVVITASHTYVNGDEVFISGVAGMTQLNGRRFLVKNKTPTTFELGDQVDNENINGATYSAYTSGGTAAKIYEIETPYAVADLPRLKFTQSADVMTLTLKGYPVQDLARLDHDDWTLSEPEFAPGQAFPTGLAASATTTGSETERYQVTAIADETFEESLPAVNNTSVTITAITKADPAVVTAAGHPYENGDEVHLDNIVGMVELNERRFIVANKAANTFELKGEDSTDHTTYVSGGNAWQTFVRITNGASTPDNAISWAEVADAQRYAVYREKNGLYGLIGETETTSFEDKNLSPDLTSSPPKLSNPFSSEDEYPGAVSYYEQRRVFGGSTVAPDTTVYSRTGAYDNFSGSTPTQADDPITATLASLEVNEIRHFVPGNDLIILTSGSEWRVNSGADAAFSADTLRQKPQSSWGCSHLRPFVAGNTILFVGDSNAEVRSLGYSLTIDGYTGSNLLLLAPHLVEQYGIVDWAYMHAPETRTVAVRADGKIIAMTFEQDQEVIAWTTWDTQGKYEAVEMLRHGASSTEDAVFMVVKRKVNGKLVRYIERSASRKFTDVRDCFFVDCGVTYDDPIAITGVTAADPVVITAPGHGLSNGDEVDLSDIEWEPEFDELDNETQPDQLNLQRFTIANVTTDTFELEDVDGSDFAAYVEGGYVRKAVSTISGLWHLEGRSVSILADGNVISSEVVENGEITFAAKVSRAHIGLKYIADIETLNVESPRGTIQGKLKNIPSVVIRFKRSRGLLVGPTSSQLTEMKWRENELMGEPTALFTGDKEVTIETVWNTNGRIFLRQRYPLPMSILAIIPEVIVSSK